MTDEIKEFRDGIFALRTRRFGTIAELMIEALYKFTKSHNQFHDRYDETKHKRITKDSHVSEILDTLPLIYQHVFTETQKLKKKKRI